MPSAGPDAGFIPKRRTAAMGFWEQHEQREAEKKAEQRLPQNAPMECAFCGHFGTDVVLAVCASCTPPTRSGCTS